MRFRPLHASGASLPLSVYLFRHRTYPGFKDTETSFGADGRTRTGVFLSAIDPRIGRKLYQLSYIGIFPASANQAGANSRKQGLPPLLFLFGLVR